MIFFFFFFYKRSKQYPQSSPLPLAGSSSSKKGRPILALLLGFVAHQTDPSTGTDNPSPGDWEEAGHPRASGSLAAKTTPYPQAPPRVPPQGGSASPLAQLNAVGEPRPPPAPTQAATDCRSSPLGTSSIVKSPLVIPSLSQAPGGCPEPFPILTLKTRSQAPSNCGLSAPSCTAPHPGESHPQPHSLFRGSQPPPLPLPSRPHTAESPPPLHQPGSLPAPTGHLGTQLRGARWRDRYEPLGKSTS